MRSIKINDGQVEFGFMSEVGSGDVLAYVSALKALAKRQASGVNLWLSVGYVFGK